MPVASIAVLAGRGLLAGLFILAGLSKVLDAKPVLAHMVQERVPRAAFPLVVLLELGAGAALLAGFHVAIAAGALSAFCLATAFFIHLHLSDRVERTQFFKDIALAGSLAVIAAGAMP